MATLDDTTDPHGRLIGADRVAGTAVYNTQGEKLGSVADVLIDKPTGRIAYAVLSFGGFLGIGNQHHPMPWSTLRYDRERGGYVVDLDREMLEGAPVLADGDTTLGSDEQLGRRVHDYYHVDPYWLAVP